MEYSIEMHVKYAKGFRAGINDAKFTDNQKPDPDTVKEDDYYTIGYIDGFDYGEDLVKMGMKNVISQDNYAAVIDRCLNNRITKSSRVK